MKNRFFLVLLLCFSLLLTACQTKDKPTAKLLGITKMTPAASLQQEQYVTLDEKTHTISKDKFILLNFWATWCIPCQKELADFEKLESKFKGNLQVVAINIGESKEKIQSFTTKHPTKLTIAVDKNKKWETYINPPSFPLTLLVTKDHKIIGTVMGARKWNNTAWQTYFQTLLNQKKAN